MPSLFDGVACPQQNYLTIYFREGVSKKDWLPIFEKYSEEIDFDYTRYGDSYLTAFDNRDENGDFTFSIDDVPDKYGIINEMCRDMIENNLIKNAMYTRYEAEVISLHSGAPGAPFTADYVSPEVFSIGCTDILTEYIMDVNKDGNADISDASAVLKAYAENAAGLQKASEENKMDVNGDGEVNIEDASYILTYYAESAAGLR